MSPSWACPVSPEPLKVSCVPTYHGHPWAMERIVQMLFADTSCENAVPPPLLDAFPCQVLSWEVPRRSSVWFQLPHLRGLFQGKPGWV